MRNDSPSDPDLLNEWLKHQREHAFHALVSRYAGLVHATAFRTCGDESLAAEVAQLTFITLARKAKSLTSCVSLGGWCHRTAMMLAKNVIRQQRRENHKRQLLAMETRNHSDSGDIWQEMQPVLDEALASLSENDREALLLRFYRSMSIREVAATLGIATDAAQKRIDRATERLRGKLLRRGIQTSGSLSAALLAGFAADAQAVTLPVSIIASKAIAAGAVGSANGFVAMFTSITKVMKISTWITPAVTLLVAGVWTVAKYQSLASLEAGNGSLLEKIAFMETKRPSTFVKTPSNDKPIDWEKLATEPDNGPEKARLLKRMKTMNREEMTAILDQIASFDCSKGRKSVLECAAIGLLGEIDPEWMLIHFSDRLVERELRLEFTLSNWAQKDMAAATAWFDAQVAAGRLDSMSFDKNRDSASPKNFPSMRTERSVIFRKRSRKPASGVPQPGLPMPI